MNRARKELRYGDPLPAGPRRIAELPMGVAVLVDGVWWLTAWRIGLHGWTWLRRIGDPRDPRWIHVADEGMWAHGDELAIELCWPVRATPDREAIDAATKDPVAR